MSEMDQSPQPVDEPSDNTAKPEPLEKLVERRKMPRFEGYKPKKFYAITLVPMLLLLAGAAPFHHFVVEVVIANPALNGLILFVMFLGAGIIMHRVYAVQKQYAILHKFTEGFKAGVPLSEILKNPRVYYSGVGHVIAHMADTEGRISSSLVQTALNEEIEHFQHNFQAGYEVPNYIVGFMIAMGLTGTFIGLLETMLGISSMLGGINSGGGDMTEAVMGLITELQKPLAGMGTAFSASLFGLVGSATLGMMMLALKYAVTEFMSALRRYISTVVEHDVQEAPQRLSAKEMIVSRGGVSEAFLSEFIVDVMDQQVQTQEVFRQSQENTVKLSVRIDKLADSINSVGELLKAQVETSKRMYDLLGYGPRMRDLAEQTLDEMRKLGEAQKQQGSLTSDTTRAVNSLDQRITSVSTQLAEQAHWMTTDGELKQSNAKGLLVAIGTLQDRMTQVVQEAEQSRNVSVDIARHLSSQAESQKKLIDLLGFGGRMRDIADQTLSEMKVLTSIQREESAAISQLGGALGNLDQRFVRISNQLAQLSTDLVNQGETGRVDIKSIAATLTSLQEQVITVAKESGQGRQIAIDIARHLAEANNKLQDLRGGNDILARIQDGTAGQAVVLDMMLSEIRTARTSIVRDLRGELRELSRLTASQDRGETS